jgi:uncharacterized protein YqjF (DUF2071 family)
MKTFLKTQWQNIIMANYEIDSEILKPYLPKGTELDYFEGKTYVSLVGFIFKDTAIFGIPIPFFGTFEEVNLRFYVIRKDGNEVRRGVVFINETVPNKIVAKVANKLYKEHYVAVPTKHEWKLTPESKELNYKWKVNHQWNHIDVKASTLKSKIKKGSIEEFIFEHYYGYTKVNETETLEYKINHLSWEVNQVLKHEIKCDFEGFYGSDFAVLNSTHPHSVLLAEGSEISVNWQRSQIKTNHEES